MKTILITAAAVGATIAGLILLYQQRLKTERNILANSSDDFHAIGNGTMKMARPAHHAMG